MDYELAKELKDAGFPQKDSRFYWREGYHTVESFDGGVSTGKEGIFSGKFNIEHKPYPRYTTAYVKWNGADLQRLDDTEVAAPTLSELIEACGGKFAALLVGPGLGLWSAKGSGMEVRGSTPEEAVANLYLSLHGKKAD